MTIPKNTIGSHVRSVFSRSTSDAYRQHAARAVEPSGSGRAGGGSGRSGGRLLEREAGVAGCVCDLELLGRRLRGREVALELEARAGQARARADAPGCGRPTRRPRPSRRSRQPCPTRRAAPRVPRGCLRRDHVRRERRRDQRSDQLRAAALVLLRAPACRRSRTCRSRRARHRGTRRVRAAQRERGREEGDARRGDLASSRARAWTCGAPGPRRRSRAIGAEHARPLERETGLRKRAPNLGQQRERLGQPTGPRSTGMRLRRRREVAACGPTRRGARRSRRGWRRPTRSARARARRSRAPSRRADHGVMRPHGVRP